MKINKHILTPHQLKALGLFSKEPFIKDFCLSGGTALVAFYYPYRYSDDLDFFSEEEVKKEEILVAIKSLKSDLGYKSLDIKTSFNRNLVFLEFGNNYTLKLEFTYYPFPRIDTQNKLENLGIDSVVDIAVNKLFTIYQQPRYRDFSDLYVILKDSKLNFQDLMKKARIKFDWNIDEFQLGKQLLQVQNKHDEPVFVEDFPKEDCNKYFLDLSKKLGSTFL